MKLFYAQITSIVLLLVNIAFNTEYVPIIGSITITLLPWMFVVYGKDGERIVGLFFAVLCTYSVLYNAVIAII